MNCINLGNKGTNLFVFMLVLFYLCCKIGKELSNEYDFINWVYWKL